ncbi:MAG TPA: alpha-hydroxy acid oxidase [Usitatibacter sp.]|jgi:L-lactate dehydrogenase (cytochrome)|nr:alpha-hydroxy acid oxidase [Usitatibacter sp.]
MPTPLRKILSLDDFEHAARKHLPRPIFGYVAGAVEDNRSHRDNRAVFEDFAFLPRVLVDTSKRTTDTTLFGHTYAAPFGIAPMGISAISAYRGDLVQAKAAMAANIPMILSATSLIRMEDICTACPQTWFQAYIPGEHDRIAALVDRVAAAGFKTLVVTVDTQITANRENNIRTGFSTPLRPGVRLTWDGLVRPHWLINTWLRTLVRHGMPYFENSYSERGAPIYSRTVDRDWGGRDHLSWEHIDAIRKRWSGRLVLKGVNSPGDAKIARDHGVEGLIVSNHGGRQLDGTLAPLRALPGVVNAVGGSMTIMMDSGIRRGTDVLKALALGAQFVFVGRPMNYAASIAGEAGVRHAIELLRGEVLRDMGMLGLNRLTEMGVDRLVRIAGVKAPEMPV